MTESKKKTAAKPVKVVRRGAIAASVWRRQSPSGFEYFDFSLSRSWKTQSTGREGYSSNFFATNADELLEVVSETAAWIAQQQSASDAASGAERDTAQAA